MFSIQFECDPSELDPVEEANQIVEDLMGLSSMDIVLEELFEEIPKEIDRDVLR
jgi:hypothetical protein